MLASKSDVKGLLQIVKVNLSSSYGSQKAWALCDSACSHSWMTGKLTRDLKLEGRPICLTVNGINSQEVVITEMVELTLSKLHVSQETYKLSQYLKENINVGTNVIDIAYLQSIYPHLALLRAERYSYTDVKLILGQDAFQANRLMVCFESDLKNSSGAVRLSLGWVLSGPLPTSSGCDIHMLQSKYQYRLASGTALRVV